MSEQEVKPKEYVLTKTDKDSLSKHHGSTEHDVIRAYNLYNFNVGDVIMGQQLDWDHNDKEIMTYIAEDSSDFPQRWIVVYKDESGPWVKTLNSKTGEPTGRLDNLIIDIVMSESYGYGDTGNDDPLMDNKFFVDQDFVDSQLLGHSYSIKEIRARFDQNIKNIENYNKGLEIKANSLDELNKLVLSNRNQRLYVWNWLSSYTFDQEDLQDDYLEFMDIKNITVVPFDKLDEHNTDYYYDSTSKLEHLKKEVKKFNKTLKTKEVLYIEYVDQNGDDCETYSFELFDVHLFSSLPKHKHEEI